MTPDAPAMTPIAGTLPPFTIERVATLTRQIGVLDAQRRDIISYHLAANGHDPNKVTVTDLDLDTGAFTAEERA